MSQSLTTSKKPYHHGDLRKVLLDGAAQLLREEGEAGLSLRKLAGRTGVSHTAPYHHFADKQTLLCAIAEEGFRLFQSVLHPPDPALDRKVDGQRIFDFVSSYIEFATAHSEYYDLMFGGHLWKSERLTDSLTRQAHGAFRDYLDSIKQWQQQGHISQTLDPLRYAQVSWSTLHGMSRLLIDGIYVDDQATHEMCKSAAEMFWRELNMQRPAPTHAGG